MISKIQKSLVEQYGFELVQALGPITKISFMEDGTADTDTGAVSHWKVQSTKDGVFLFLYLDGNLWGSLGLTVSGDWKGRQHGVRGTALVRTPELHKKLWKYYSDPRNEFDEETIPRKPPSFMYKEDLVRQIDWSDTDYSLADQLDRKKYPGDIALIVAGCDRPQYMRQVLEHLRANKDVDSYPMFVFLDKAEEESRAETQLEQEQMVNELFPKAVVIKRPRNIGCGRNLIDARIQIFDNLEYKYAFVFEDDMVVSSTYLALCKRLMTWAERTYTNVGSVQAWNKCLMDKGKKKDLLREVHVSYTNWWGYLMSRELWQAIIPEVTEYQKLFLGARYEDRPHRSIVHWFDLARKTTLPARGDSPFPRDPAAHDSQRNYYSGPPTGQDAMTQVLSDASGFVRLVTTVNRAKYIGKLGIHMNTRTFARDGFDHIRLDEFKDDSRMKKFVPRGEKSPSHTTRKLMDGVEAVSTL